MKRLSQKKARALIGGGGYTLVGAFKSPGSGIVIETVDGVEGEPITEFFPPGEDA